MSLWHVKDHISFDEGGRIGRFSGFRDTAQSEAVARPMAERAAAEVLRTRELQKLPLLTSLVFD